MTTADAVARVKRKFGIAQADTSLDTDITDAVSTGIDCLAPYLEQPLTEDNSVTLAANASSFTNPVAGSEIRKIYFQPTSSSYNWLLITEWSIVNDVIYIYDSFTVDGSIKILATGEYDDTETSTIPRDFTVPLIDFACSEFASYLAGDKSKFNIYSQVTGVAGVSEMISLSEYYENRANARVRQIANSSDLL